MASSQVALSFPADHRSHPDFRNEWWYLTGHLQDPVSGNRYGFQLTLFRFALDPPGGLASTNSWVDRQLYMGHFAVSDLGGGSHRAVERFGRPGAGLAGAGGTPLRIWVGDWQLQAREAGTLFPLHLEAVDRGAEIGLSLVLEPLKPRVLQGEAGFSRKSREGGGSFYYSYTRLKARGSLSWSGRQAPVQGAAWYDHEWSSNVLAPDQAGWDWFSLQLDDGRELMAFRFRTREGETGWRQLSLVDRAGRITSLDPQQLLIEPLAYWRSDEGIRYPVRWRLKVPEAGLDLEVEALLQDQEMALSVRYWEGAVRVRGSHRGQGFVELTGYQRGD
nr:lipocalin-like domain-containing protein [Motiliproteus sp. SC1-56]